MAEPPGAVRRQGDRRRSGDLAPIARVPEMDAASDLRRRDDHPVTGRRF